MVKLTSPYNFVPINKEVYLPNWADKVSQDLPFEDGEDGWIEVTWKNISPLVVRTDNKKGSLSVHVKDADGKRRYFIPGTSMKGMLRSTLEILSFGKMEQYDNRYFAQRTFRGSPTNKFKEVNAKDNPQYDLRGLVQKEQKPVEGKDLCETIFGYTDGSESLRGRVQVSHAFCTTEPDGKELFAEVKGVLGEPKPNFYPLYLKQTGGPRYKNFNNADGIAGRKLYRVHANGSVMPLPKGNNNENTVSSFRPLNAGLTFFMRINLHNMRPVEIGAILSALTLHDTKGAWHNLGGAKSFGNGKLECQKVELKKLSRTKEDYMKAFEEEMECFTCKKLNQKWAATEQVKALVNILSEHKNDDVRMMSLKEYMEIYRCNPFQSLKEGDNKVTSLLSEDKQEEENKREPEEEQRQREQQEKENKRRQEAEQKKREQEEEEKQRREERLAAGLAAQLDTKDGNGKYKRDTVKKALDITSGWLKQCKREQLTADEKNDLYSTLKRLKTTPHKDDRRFWQNPNDRTWGKIATLIGEELTKQLIS